MGNAMIRSTPAAPARISDRRVSVVRTVFAHRARAGPANVIHID
jgi:hypothetical protein